MVPVAHTPSMARVKQTRPVVGRTYRGHLATQADVDQYDATLAMIEEAPIVRRELHGGKMFVVRRLPSAMVLREKLRRRRGD